jgi:hypothetical protein
LATIALQNGRTAEDFSALMITSLKLFAVSTKFLVANGHENRD